MSSHESPLLQERALELLRSKGPLPAHADGLALFGRFVGAWDAEVVFYAEDGTEVFRQPGEWSFSWALDGRCIQDVLIYPNAEAHLSAAVGERRIGTTLRHFDPKTGHWRVVWLGATTGFLAVLTGRAVGEDIHIEGPDPEGHLLRWMFTEVSRDSFVWKGFLSKDGGATWRRTQEMACRRRVG
ncbi:hypothetical protein HPC49_44685 [Pyxidicoccus fallax]|uniref:DUF1579 domain-containing protein n=1 Tax=Pyxidicoccus fallax TaxID=394095 RepID=A0A848LRR7_9BACT|nr:hypothetical protein [Pyxidicoccus fallax]NMO20446.1 hypothetical protein [Pyxidicoccus fallax]NPC85280.1 hypothetical protein [Pyxidicoccus fallax]